MTEWEPKINPENRTTKRGPLLIMSCLKVQEITLKVLISVATAELECKKSDDLTRSVANYVPT